MGRGKKENADVAKATKPVGKSATSFIAGSTAGLVSSGLLQPLEVVKTRMQAHRLKAGFSINKSAWATAGCVVRDEGIRGLWAGVSASCIRTACGAGLYFLLLERVTRELNAKFPASKDASQTLQGARTFAIGAASRSLAAAMLCPLTVVKTRME